jgi:hypothetical protein
MGSRKDRNLVTNNSQFYFLIPNELLDTCRREAARKSISTASFMREALVAYLARKDVNDATASPGSQVIAFRYAESKEPLV